MSIAFKPEEATDALKEFVGQIIETDYAEEPFGMKGAVGITRKGKVLCVKIRTESYEKDQFELGTEERDFEFATGRFVGFMEATLDTDGSLSLVKAKRKNKRGYRYIPRVTVVNTKKKLLEYIKQLCYGGSVYPRSNKSEISKKDIWEFDMNRTQMREILPNLRLCIKDRQRVLLLEALDILKDAYGGHTEEEWERLEEIHQEIMRLNGRFPVA